MPAPLPDPTKPFHQQSTIILAAMCVFGEARNQSDEAKAGVLCVVRNRARLGRSYMGGKTWAGVMLRKSQFDCFLESDPNSHKLLTPLEFEHESVWEACYMAAFRVYTLGIPDSTNGAIFYFSYPIVEPPKAWGPVELTAQIDGLKFWREVAPANRLNAA